MGLQKGAIENKKLGKQEFIKPWGHKLFPFIRACLMNSNQIRKLRLTKPTPFFPYMPHFRSLSTSSKPSFLWSPNFPTRSQWIHYLYYELNYRMKNGGKKDKLMETDIVSPSRTPHCIARSKFTSRREFRLDSSGKTGENPQRIVHGTTMVGYFWELGSQNQGQSALKEDPIFRTEV